MKAGFVAIIGRPSTGKSTLINRICGRKVSIVTPVPQTTRNKVRGIYTEERGQVIFVDTPGYHNSERKFNLYMRELVNQAMEEADLILYLLDASRLESPASSGASPGSELSGSPAAPGSEEQAILDALSHARHIEGNTDLSQPGSPAQQAAIPIVAVLNKIDTAGEKTGGRGPAAGSQALIEKAGAFLAGSGLTLQPLPVSATEGTGIDELLAALFEQLPESGLLYPEEIYTDQEPAFRIAEIIREKAMLQTRDEVPHALFVEVADIQEEEPEFAENPKPAGSGEQERSGENPGRLWIRAFIHVERNSQQGILVGRGGKTIREIRTGAQKDIQHAFERPVYLDLRVKVSPNWRKQDRLIGRMVY